MSRFCKRLFLPAGRLKQQFLVLAFSAALLLFGYSNLHLCDDSDYGAVSLWYLRWACGNCPDMLVIGSKDNQYSQYRGKNVYLCVAGQFWDKKYNHDDRYGNNEYKLYCTGRFKKSIKMKLYEMNSIFDFLNAQGVFFDADNCTPIKTTDLENKLIDSLLVSTCKSRHYKTGKVFAAA